MAVQTQFEDLVFFCGDDWPAVPFSVVTPVTDADGNTISFDQVNITGWTIEFAIYADPECRTTAIFSLAIGTGITVTDATHGLGYFSVTKAQSALLQGGPGGLPTKYYVQVQRVITGSGLRRTIGLITIPVRQ
jgi:hypothetical protein